MTKYILSLLLFIGFSTLYAQDVSISVSPETFNESEEITITFSGIDTGAWGSTDLYLWTWYYDLEDVQVHGNDNAINGEWTNSLESQKLTDNGDGTYSFTMTPTTFFAATGIGKIGVLAKTDNGSSQTADFHIEVGAFQLVLTSPTDKISVVNAGDAVIIQATTSLPADYELFVNGASKISRDNATSFFSAYNVSQTTNFKLQVTELVNGTVLTEEFTAVVSPTPTTAAVPAGMVNGINWDASNPNTATLVLFAPGKDFVHVIGNFNDWKIKSSYLMNYDPATERYWITLNNLTQSDVLFQYVVDGKIRIADPYSTYVLDGANDFYIEDAATFFPEYPRGKTEYMVTWFQTDPTEYQWQVTDFERPAQEDLVIYELLIRDFVKEQSYDAVVEKLDYLENLGINAIELMPVSEFDGNSSWGYNPAFHMALDKFYGSKNDFKAFVDAAHARGIAVILDVVYNHATGQNPYFRLWNECGGCYTGLATAENPFFNIDNKNQAWGVFNDMDHESSATQYYLDRMNEFWLTEYNIDGYRFDFTKGFTNVPGNGGGYDQSRINILTRMYDEIREVDATAYVILEHFAPNSEETVLIEHRATSNSNEPGMMVWANFNHQYAQSVMGYASNSNFYWIDYMERGWSTPSNVSYMESHDEERITYKALTYGAAQGSYNVTDLNTALSRLKLAGAFFFTIPGPKMIYQFGELGYDYSINQCQDGTISGDCRTSPKPLKWIYSFNTKRKEVYDTWSELIQLRQSQAIFSTDNFWMDVDGDRKWIHLNNDNAGPDEIEYVTIIGNFGLATMDIDPKFQETGTWYNLMTGEEINVSNVNTKITLEAGEFLILGNKKKTMGTASFDKTAISLYPNPASLYFSVSTQVQQVTLYNLQGKRVKHFIGDFRAGHAFSIDSLQEGLYFVQIQTINGTQTKKLIIK